MGNNPRLGQKVRPPTLKFAGSCWLKVSPADPWLANPCLYTAADLLYTVYRTVAGPGSGRHWRSAMAKNEDRSDALSGGTIMFAAVDVLRLRLRIRLRDGEDPLWSLIGAAVVLGTLIAMVAFV